MEESQIEISKIIDSCLTRNNELLDFHSNNQYKNYTFSSFYPIKKNKLYLAGEIYTVTIRTVDQMLVNHFHKFLDNESSSTLKALPLEIKAIPKKYICQI